MHAKSAHMPRGDPDPAGSRTSDPQSDEPGLPWPISGLPGIQTAGPSRSQLVVGLLLVLDPLAVLITAMIVVRSQTVLSPGSLVAILTTGAFFVTTAIALRGHVDLAAGLATAMAVVPCVSFLVLPTPLPATAVYAFFAAPVAMSSLLLPVWATGGTAGLALAAVLLVPGDWFLRGSLAIQMAMVGGLLTTGSYLLERERAHTEAQHRRLETTRSWLREAQRASGVGAFTWKPGQEPWWSPEVYRLLGYEPGEIEPSLDIIRQHVHPDDREQFQLDLEAALEDPESGSMGCRVVRNDGEIIHTLWQTNVLGPEDDPRFVGAVQDVTGRREHEALEQRVAVERARTHSLQRAVQIASHEFREPIRSVMTSVQRVDRNLDADGATHRELESIRASAARLRHVTDALVHFTETLARPLDPEAVDLEEVLETARLSLSARRGEEVAVQADTLPGVWVDRSFIVTVFEELLANALDHGKPPVTVAAEDSGDRCQIRLRDEGDGIPPEYNERAFEPFERLAREGWEQHPGLGLTLARRIVERHGGTMTARDLPDGGTEISFSLPQADPDSSPTPGSTPVEVDHARS